MTADERRERNLKKRRRQVAKRNISILLCTVFMITVASVVFGSSFSAAKNDVEVEKYYKSIEIQLGDTLWDLAEEYCDDQVSIKEYISEVKELNGLGTSTIHEGQYLVVPYYK